MWSGMPFSAFRSSATNCVTYLRMHCSSDRTGKWRISIGYQPRSGTSPVPNASWFPRPTRTSAAPRCADLKCVLSGCGWNDGAQSRAVIRSAKNRSSSGRGTKLRQAPRTTPKRSGIAANSARKSPPRGHQNSSASVFRTQSAPNSTAASRAIRVTHSLWRRSSPGSRIEMQVTLARVALEDLRRPVLRAIVGRDDEVDPGSRGGTRSARRRCRPRRARGAS